MYITCLDLEGVLVPEIWIDFAKASSIPELTRTTRDEPDYDKLMKWRLGILKEHGLGIREIQDVIASIEPLPGNSLEIAENGEITGYRMRIADSKLSTVKALQSIGFETIAAGDSYNDLDMIKAGKAGFLFRSTDKIKADHPEIPAFETYEELMAGIRSAMKSL